MSYRNITVDGTDYKYVVGKSVLKVKGLDPVCKYKLLGLDRENDKGPKADVKPSDVADYIRESV